MPTETLLPALVFALLLAVCVHDTNAAELPQVKDLSLTEVSILSSVDGKEQPIVIGVPASHQEGAPMPLLVGLHTWSSHYAQMVSPYGNEAARRKWLVVCPHYRGPNLVTNPDATEAGGSILAQHDIIDAIDHMRAYYTVDDRRIYMIGGSGGGHMTCLMATKYPDVFAACAAYCPITDFRAWHAQQNSYAKHIEAVCGGKPGDSAAVDFEYARRSPRTFITNAANANLLIGHGDKDATIWPEQSWETFRCLKGLPQHKVLFESWSAGHSGKTREGLDWAATKARSLDPPKRLDIVTDEAKRYFWLYVEPAGPLKLGKCTATLVRKGDTVGKSEIAEMTELTLTTTDVSKATVNLSDLGLSAPDTLPEGVGIRESTLVFAPLPVARSREYKITF